GAVVAVARAHVAIGAAVSVIVPAVIGIRGCIAVGVVPSAVVAVGGHGGTPIPGGRRRGPSPVATEGDIAGVVSAVKRIIPVAAAPAPAVRVIAVAVVAAPPPATAPLSLRDVRKRKERYERQR